MTGEDMYEEFKNALGYPGVGFRGMAEVQVSLQAGRLCFTNAAGAMCTVVIPMNPADYDEVGGEAGWANSNKEPLK